MSEGKKEILLGDCLELMKDIPNGSIDMVLTDPPYGVTKIKWDSVIDLDLMWKELYRITKENGAIVLFGTQPFVSKLISSNYEHFKYDVIWCKDKPTNIGNANKQHLRMHEHCLIFYRKQPTYNPQRKYFPRTAEGKKRFNDAKRTGYKFKSGGTDDFVSNKIQTDPSIMTDFEINFKVPHTLLQITSIRNNQKEKYHQTQKPIELMEYFIKTFTNEGETVLDFTAGSGTTAIACLKTNRQFIVMEKEQKYYDIILKRVADFNKSFYHGTLFDAVQ